MPLSGRSNGLSFCILTAILAAVTWPLRADVPTPPTPPPVPPGYCSTIYNELSGDLSTFNILLQTPPIGWIPIAGGPPLYAANLAVADGNTGPGLSTPGYNFQAQMQEEKALGAQAVLVQVGFPLLYEPFFGSEAALEPYLMFYSQVAQAARAAGLKLIVENDVLLSNDVETGWSNVTAYYATLDWNQYMAGRATMAATVAQVMQPDYLVLAEEPGGEALQTGQNNVNIPSDAAQMIAGEIAAVQALNLPNIKLGAGVGTWLQVTGTSCLTCYLDAYVTLPLDYIDFHLYPINTEEEASFIANTLIVASVAALAGKPIAMSEGWLWKMENSEWDVLNGDDYRARDPFGFWAPLDAIYLQTVQALANYTNMLYVAPEGPDYLFVYQTYGGTAANGGAATCMCTTASCSNYDIVHTETTLAASANAVGDYTTTGFSYNAQLVQPPDTIPPSMPIGFNVSAGYVQATLTWSPSTDNVGVVGYNVYQCTPPAQGQPCTGVYIGQTTGTQFVQTGLTSNVTYNFQVQAFDMANNNSPLSAVVSVTTLRVAAGTPTNLTATAVSPAEIQLSWSPPTDSSGLSKYLVYGGTSITNLAQIGTAPSTKTTFNNTKLSASTTYYYGVEAVESGLDSPMSPTAFATTLPLLNPPNNVAGAPTVTTVVVSWQEQPALGALPVSSYKVSVGTSPGTFTSTYTDKTTGYSGSYTVRDLQPNTTYYFQVVAVDSGNDDSVPSSEIAVTTMALPPAPTGLQATTPAATEIALTWSWTQAPNGNPISRYLVECGPSPSNLTSYTSKATSYTVRGLDPSTIYFCQVVAVDSANNDSPPSSQISVTTPAMPAAPTNVLATASSSTKVTVTWTETIPPTGLGIASYTVWRATLTGGYTQLPNKITTTSFTDSTVLPNTTYTYEVSATDTGKDVSALSAASPAVTTP